MTRDEIEAEKQRLRSEYGRLFDELSMLLFRSDPIGLNFESNTDEYDPEARTILPQLRHCVSAKDATRVVHAEFVRWFGSDTAGEESRYQSIGEQVWKLWEGRTTA